MTDMDVVNANMQESIMKNGILSDPGLVSNG
jgi:hypothetical protein